MTAPAHASMRPAQAAGHPDRVATAMVLVAMAGMAHKGIFARLAYADGMGVADVLVARVILAAPICWLVARWFGRLGGGSWGRMDWRALRLGGLFVVAAGADFVAVERLGAGPSRVLLFSYPGFVLMIEAWRRRRFPPLRQVVAFAVAWSGLVLVSVPDGVDALTSAQLVGVGWALLAAVSFAWFTTASQEPIRHLGSMRFVVLSNAGGALALVALLPWLDVGVGPVTGSGLGWLAAMVLIAVVGPVFLTFEGIGRIGAEQVGLLMLLGPVVTLAAAWLFLGERLTTLQLIGSGLAVGSIGALRWLGPTPRERGLTAEPRVPPSASS